MYIPYPVELHCLAAVPEKEELRQEYSSYCQHFRVIYPEMLFLASVSLLLLFFWLQFTFLSDSLLEEIFSEKFTYAQNIVISLVYILHPEVHFLQLCSLKKKLPGLSIYDQIRLISLILIKQTYEKRFKQ